MRLSLDGFGGGMRLADVVSFKWGGVSFDGGGAGRVSFEGRGVVRGGDGGRGWVSGVAFKGGGTITASSLKGGDERRGGAGWDSFKGGGAGTECSLGGGDGRRGGAGGVSSRTGENCAVPSLRVDESLGGDLDGMVTFTALLGVRSSCLWIFVFLVPCSETVLIDNRA